MNRRTSLAEITGGREEGSFSIKGEERLSARLLNRHCQIPPPSALQTLLPRPTKGEKYPYLGFWTFRDPLWYGDLSSRKEIIRVRRIKRIKKCGRKKKKGGGSPTGGIFAALWPWTKTISWDNLVKDHSFPRGTLQRGRFFFATRLVNSNRHWLRSALPLQTNGVLLFVEQKSKFFLLINHSKYSVEISKDTGFYRFDHFANWESFLPVPISTTFFGRFDCAISPRTENWTTRFQVSFLQWVVVSPSFHFHSRKTDISTYVYEVARNSYSIDRLLFEPRWIYLEVKERNNGRRGRNGRRGARK